jgi:hypothetical protein
MSFYAQVMIAGLLGLGAVALFNRRPLVLHGLVMALYVFRYELTNKITFMMLVSWLVVHLMRSKTLGERQGVILLASGFAVFFCRGMSYLFYGIDDASLVFREVIVSYVNAVIWAYLAYATIKDFRSIMTLVGIYAMMRTLESGVGGLMLYHFPDTALQFVLEKRQLSVEAETTLATFSRDERLMSLAGMNPVDTSFHLAICIIFLLGRLVTKIRWMEIVAAILCAGSMLYTWSRTGWIGLALGLGIFSALVYTPSAWKKYLAALLVLGAVLFVERRSIEERYYSDNRNLAESTVVLRVVLQKQYLAKISDYGFFGVGLPNPQIPVFLDINPPISSESMLLSALIETGWIGGLVFSLLNFYALFRSAQLLRQARRHRQSHTEGYFASAMLFTAFVILLVMAVTFYLSWSDPITWMVIGLIFAADRMWREVLVGERRFAAAPQRLDMNRRPRSVPIG